MLIIFHPFMCRCKVLLLFSFMVNNVILRQLTSSMRPPRVMRSTARFARSRMISMIRSYPQDISEVAVYNGAEEEVHAALNFLSKKRPQLDVIYDDDRGTSSSDKSTKRGAITWSAHSGSLQVDCTLLEPLFLGNTRFSDEITAQKWDEMLSQRSSVVGNALSEDPMKGKIRARNCRFYFLVTYFLLR